MYTNLYLLLHQDDLLELLLLVLELLDLPHLLLQDAFEFLMLLLQMADLLIVVGVTERHRLDLVLLLDVGVLQLLILTVLVL